MVRWLGRISTSQLQRVVRAVPRLDRLERTRQVGGRYELAIAGDNCDATANYQ